MSKTPWKKIVSDPDFLGEADFGEGEEKVVTISRIASGVKVQTADGKQEKAVVYFAEKIKPMILNVARSKAISKVAGSKFIEDWPGTVIQLYIEDNVKAFGDIVSAVRVRPTKPIVRQAVKCSDCGNDIQGAMGKTAEFMVAYTKKNYGVPLCAECASKRAAKKSEQEVNDNGTDETDG